MRFVQLSDPHIVAPEKQPVLGIDTIARLRDAVSAVNRLRPAPDFVVLTGDLTNDEEEASYRQVRDILTDLEAPCHLALGNHDARRPFRRIMLDEPEPKPDRVYYAFTHDAYRIVVLDTLDEGQVPGLIDDEQLAWLDGTLTAHGETPTVILLHHPPLPVGAPWMDELMLREADRVLKIIDTHPWVRWVLCGHVHHTFRIERGHWTLFTAPSVSIQFRKEPLPPPAERPYSFISTDPPAFRIVDLHDNVFETTVCTVSGIR